MKKQFGWSLVRLLLCTMTLILFSCDKIDPKQGGDDPDDPEAQNCSYTINNCKPISIKTALLFNGNGTLSFAFSRDPITDMNVTPPSYFFIDINASDIGKTVSIGSPGVNFT